MRTEACKPQHVKPAKQVNVHLRVFQRNSCQPVNQLFLCECFDSPRKGEEETCERSSDFSLGEPINSRGSLSGKAFIVGGNVCFKRRSGEAPVESVCLARVCLVDVKRNKQMLGKCRHFNLILSFESSLDPLRVRENNKVVTKVFSTTVRPKEPLQG